MNPKQLRLKGFAGIKSGLGRDEINIDLGMDGGLVAIIGKNGAGKSTIMDNLHPFRLMPSRAGGYSPGSFSYYDHCGSDAVKELVWEHGGELYKSTLVIKQTAKTKKQEAYLAVSAGSDWIPAKTKDGTVSDGKTATYDACLEEIIGTPQLFFTSAFSAQGRRQLSSYTNGDIKGLLSELLGLQEVIDLGVKANTVAKLLDVHRYAMRGVNEAVEKAQAEMALAEQAQDSSGAALMLSDAARKQARAALVDAQSELVALQAGERDLLAARQRKAELSAQLDATKARLEATLAAFASQERQATARQDAALKDLSERLMRKKKAVSDTQDSITGFQDLVSRRTEAAAAAMASGVLEQAMIDSERKVEALHAEKSNQQDLAAEIATEQGRINELANDGKHKAATYDGLRQQAKLADEVPCLGTDLQGRCKLLVDACDAKAKMPVVEAEITALRDQYRAGADALAQRRVLLNPKIDQELRNATTALAEARGAVAENAKLATLLPRIEQAGAMIDSLRQQKAEAEAEVSEIEESMQAVVGDATLEIADIKMRREADMEAGQMEVDAIQRAICSLPPDSESEALDRAKAKVEEIERALSEAEARSADLSAQKADAKARILAAEAVIAGAQEALKKVDALNMEISQWNLLAKALSNDGIVALAIDDAGPTLAGLANDLLLACFGPRFTVRIDTQAAKANGDMKETFDVIVFDSERGDEKSIRDMSGGERVYINEAMMRAIALYQAQSSGAHYECLFADESDGALDPERKQQFIAMKREALRLSGSKREIFISHTPELWDMADVVIDMAALQ